MRHVGILIIILLIYATGYSQEAQWRGPNRDGRFPEINLLKKWPQPGPTMILKVANLGAGFSSPIFYNGIIYITGKKEDLDYLSAVDMSGKVRYSVSYGKAWVETYPETRCTPTLDSDRLYVISGLGELVCLNAKNGKIAFQYKYLSDDPGIQTGATNNTNSPLVRGNDIFISKGYDQYGVMLTVSEGGNSIREKWRTSVMDTHHGHYVYEGNYLYGSNWINNAQGNWICLDWDSGKVMYNETWHTKGSIVYADGMLYCYEERGGNVALVRPNPEKFEVVSSFAIKDGTGPHWAHPYIADKKLFIRHGEVLMVFDIKG